MSHIVYPGELKKVPTIRSHFLTLSLTGVTVPHAHGVIPIGEGQPALFVHRGRPYRGETHYVPDSNPYAALIGDEFIADSKRIQALSRRQ